MSWSKCVRLLAYFWAGPWTLLGLLIVLYGWKRKATVVRQRGTIGCYGESIERLLRMAPISGGAGAITIGHVILACNADCFDSSLEHELVHVRQYERWGPFFVPAYLIASAWLIIRRKDFYRENPFEKPAFELDRQRREVKHKSL